MFFRWPLAFFASFDDIGKCDKRLDVQSQLGRRRNWRILAGRRIMSVNHVTAHMVKPDALPVFEIGGNSAVA